MKTSIKLFVATLSLSYLMPAIADCTISTSIIGTNSSFINSCSNCIYDSSSGLLVASCANLAGEQVNSSIIVGTCLQEIVNEGGTLECASGTKLHNGSYRGSCENIQASGKGNTTIVANCKTTNRYPRFVSTSINIAACPVGDLENVDGELKCGNPH